ncbi:MAG: cupredoxin domain-containing protein [Chthoniobacterales bacterium]
MDTKRVLTIALAAAFVASALPARAEEEKTVTEKTAEVWDKTKEVAKETGEVIADKTKEAVAAVEDAIDKPDADAKKVNVQITDKGIQMDHSLPAGKTAFIVKNTGKEKHNFEIEGTNLTKSFWLAISPGDSKTMQVDLKAGTYEADCKLHGTKEPHVKLTVK